MRNFLRVLVLFLALSSLAAAAANVDAIMNATWVQADSPHFRVVTDQNGATARQLVTDLERMRHFSSRILGIDTIEVMAPLTIVAIGNSRLFEKFGLPENYAGVFSNSLQGVAAMANVKDYIGNGDTISFARLTVLHEYHHFLVRMTQQTVAYPMWCDEGMAEYFSTFRYNNATVSVGDLDEHDNRVSGLYGASGNLHIDTAKLFNTSRLDYADTTLAGKFDLHAFYARAGFVINYFNSSPQLRAQLARYLRLYNLGLSQDRAAELAFKRSYAELDKDIIKYLSRGLSARVFKANDGPFQFPPVEIRVEPLDSPHLAAALSGVLAHMAVQHEVRDGVLARNLQLNPASAQAHVASLLYSGAGYRQSQVEELLQRFPNNAELLSLLGDALRDHADAVRVSGLPGWQALQVKAREHYRKAIKADPTYPAAYYGLGELYLHLPATEPIDEGIAGLDTAAIYQTTPENFRDLATLALRAGHRDEALAALRHAVAFVRGDGPSEDALLLDNLEMLNEVQHSTPTASADGLLYRDGSRYAGQVSSLKPHGIGKLTRLNGSYIEGKFADGLPVEGKLVSERGGDYEGQFAAGVAGGQGTLHAPGLSYTGAIALAKPSGRGVLNSAEGRYEGAFADGLPHGQGRFTPARGTAVLTGAWLYGSHVWPAADGEVFVGAIDAAGQPSGAGYCHAIDGASLRHCRRGDDHGKSAKSKE